MSKETLTKSIREIPDFPIPGILFYDVTTLSCAMAIANK